MADTKPTTNPATSGPVAVYTIAVRHRDCTGTLGAICPIYVGQSRMPQHRFATHLTRCHSGTLAARIARHIKNGDALQMAVVEWYASREIASVREQQLIRHFVRQGFCIENREAQPGGRYFMETGESSENQPC